MGKTKRRKGFEHPTGGTFMKEKVESRKPPEWHRNRAAESMLVKKLRKLKKK